MTADERIERLLNKAGQTIEDCPFFYTKEQRSLAKEAVRKRMRSGLFVTVADYQDYILHLTDVIDRLEWALDKQLAHNGEKGRDHEQQNEHDQRAAD